MESTAALSFLLPIMMATFSAVFLVLSRFNVSSGRAWGLGFGFCALGFMASVVPLPVEIGALAGDAFFVAGFFFYAEALLLQFSMPLYRHERAAFVLIYLLLDIYVVLVERSLHAELFLNDVATSCLLGFALLKVMDRANKPADRALIAMSSLVVLDTLVRVIVFVFLLKSSDRLEDFATSSYAWAMQITTSAVGLLFALSVLGSITATTLLRYRDAADRDPLTGLYNRRGFDGALAPKKDSGRYEGTILICDIDHFKQVNDRFGHGAGDRVIAELAAELDNSLPRHAISARFGGEEFVIFIPGASLAEGGVLAQSIRIRFAARDWRHIAIDRQITVSFGVATIGESEATPVEAMVRADECLYAAKAAGRNQVVLEGGRFELRPAPEQLAEALERLRAANA
jgi:diguanylate cyclase (GGDEF)-like protein